MWALDFGVTSNRKAKEMCFDAANVAFGAGQGELVRKGKTLTFVGKERFKRKVQVRRRENL